MPLRHSQYKKTTLIQKKEYKNNLVVFMTQEPTHRNHTLQCKKFRMGPFLTPSNHLFPHLLPLLSSLHEMSATMDEVRHGPGKGALPPPRLADMVQAQRAGPQRRAASPRRARRRRGPQAVARTQQWGRPAGPSLASGGVWAQRRREGTMLAVASRCPSSTVAVPA